MWCTSGAHIPASRMEERLNVFGKKIFPPGALIRGMGTKRILLYGALVLAGVAVFSACTNNRYAGDLPVADMRVMARYEVETTHADERVSADGACTSWFNFIPEPQDTSGGYYSDVGSLFSGLSPVQSLALRAAIAKACRRHGADFLLLPEYEMTTTTYWFFYESATCTVSGVPAKFGKIRQIPLSE